MLIPHQPQRLLSLLAGILFLALLLSAVYYLSHHGIEYPRYFKRFCFSLAGVGALYGIIRYRNRKSAPLPPLPLPCQSPAGKKWTVIFLSLVLICSLSLALLLSTAWLKGDDYQFIMTQGLRGRFEHAVTYYGHIVSRLGEIFGYLIGLSKNRWEQIFFTPIFAVLLPWGMLRLVGNGKVRLRSAEGCRFFLFTFFLSLLSCRVLGNWANYFDWAVTINYLWSSVAALFFLSFYRRHNWIQPHPCRWKNRLACTGVFLLGVWATWGTEVSAVTLVPLLTGWMIFMIRSNRRIPSSCLTGYAGALWGALMLFISPALQRRAEYTAVVRKLDLSALSPEALSDYLHHLSWDQVNLLKDATNTINFHDIPTHLHIYFLPYLTDRYLESAAFTLPAFLLLFLLVSIRKHPECKRNLLTGLFLLLLSYYSATAYLAACIPHCTALQPCIIILLSACCYLYLRLPYKWLPQSLFALASIGVALSLFVPAGIESWEYKKYDRERIHHIETLRDQGVKDIVLEPMFKAPPKDPLRLIGGVRGGLSNDPEKYPNPTAADKYGVDSIVQQ